MKSRRVQVVTVFHGVQGCRGSELLANWSEFCLRKATLTLEGRLSQSTGQGSCLLILCPYQNPESIFLFQFFILNSAKKKPSFSKGAVIYLLLLCVGLFALYCTSWLFLKSLDFKSISLSSWAYSTLLDCWLLFEEAGTVTSGLLLKEPPPTALLAGRTTISD